MNQGNEKAEVKKQTALRQEQEMERITILFTPEQHAKHKKRAEKIGIPLNKYILSILSATN
ncbi:TPA: hypothetical protein O2E65_001543 [Listeria monocytogenes]|uniref:hypothetical protein n=1 Tax=Listeria monocytogenes TaxID=1639 RepID=UPI0010ED3CFB|nr:hypothetical protein [Listeria monocytogenes]EAC7181330.1 hypothetical protein [Listeria monocytogenes]EAF1189809.1 hypothetical protein [Listeria monocytogenes]EJC6460096.1 hypothetical protein [Listeria monocytogenes]MBC6362294.1 hypothetical protein [Listeria monocytogenes]HCY9071802.1 hypothetical protein [Listeria monocytogenes]